MEQRARKLNNSEPAWSNYIHSKGASLGLPIAGNFELTSNCNFNCRMCYVHSGTRRDPLSADDWIEIGRTAVQRGMVFLLLTGGEPFLRPDFKEIYGALSKMGLLISINTNASLIDDEMFEFLKKNPPLRMNISLYACNDDVYESLCGKRACGIVKNNIIRLHEAGISVKINSSITPYNSSEIEGIYAFGRDVGVPVTATSYMYPPVRVNSGKYGKAPARFDAEEAAAQMLRCREQYLTEEQLKAGASFEITDDDNCGGDVRENMRCRAGKTAFWITWDGRMLPCGMFPHMGFDLRELGFDGAWSAVREFTKTVMMPKECTGCPRRDRCSVCAAACFSETGDSGIRPEYICRMTETYDELIKEKYGNRG